MLATATAIQAISRPATQYCEYRKKILSRIEMFYGFRGKTTH